MATKEVKTGNIEEQEVSWSSRHRSRNKTDRRSNADRREMSGRAITVPDMRFSLDRRNTSERRKVHLVITGRAIDA